MVMTGNPLVAPGFLWFAYGSLESSILGVFFVFICFEILFHFGFGRTIFVLIAIDVGKQE